MTAYRSKPNIGAYPLCAGRGVLVTFLNDAGTESEHRVDFNLLNGKLTYEERIAWDRQSVAIPADEHGILPERVEQFLSTFERKDDGMATKTAKKKSAKKKAAKRSAAKKPGKKLKAETNGHSAAPFQKMLVHDAFPDRDPEIESLIVGYLEAQTEAEAAIAKANDREVTAQKALKEAVRAAGLDSYSSYDIRYVVELKKLDDRLKVRPVKKKEATPCVDGDVVQEETEGGDEVN